MGWQVERVKPVKYTTEYGVDITRRIYCGETLLADSVLEAEALARKYKTFYYPVYQDGKFSGMYGVPK